MYVIIVIVNSKDRTSNHVTARARHSQSSSQDCMLLAEKQKKESAKRSRAEGDDEADAEGQPNKKQKKQGEKATSKKMGKAELAKQRQKDELLEVSSSLHNLLRRSLFVTALMAAVMPHSCTYVNSSVCMNSLHALFMQATYSIQMHEQRCVYT